MADVKTWDALRKWAKDAAAGKTDKIPYIDIIDLIDEVSKLRAALENATNQADHWQHIGETAVGDLIACSKDRAALQAQQGDVCAEMRALCSACGGTGDVTTPTGEWRGECDCPASQWKRDAKEAERYRLLRRGQCWSIIDGIGNTLRADELDAAIDAAMLAARREG